MAKHKEDSQYNVVLKHLKTGAELHPLQALKEYGVFRLGAIVYKLKKEGYDIQRRLEHFEKPSGRKGYYAVYRLEVDEA